MALSDEEYWKQGSDRLEEYLGMVNSIIDSFPEPRRSQVRKMMDGPVGTQFMTAPASTRRAFHNAFPCGLVAHSLSVVKYAVKFAEMLAPGRWPTWKVMFVALFHDLGKAGSADNPYYVKTTDDWKLKRDEFYEVSKEEYQPNSEKSLYIMQQNGIVLDYEETVAIRLNDGSGARGNEAYLFNEPDLSLVVHWADHWASKQEKALGKKDAK